MARNDLVSKRAIGAFATHGANAADLVMEAASVADKNQFAPSGNDLVFAHNTGASARTITITSAPDEYGRTGDIASYSLGAGEYAVFGPFPNHGWKQADGKIYLEADNAEVLFGVVAVPG